MSDDQPKIPYTIRTDARTRGLRIVVHADGSVVVSKSKRIPRLYAEAWVAKKMDWISDQREKMAERPQKILAHYSAKDFKELKDKAYDLVDSRVAYFNKFYKYDIARVTIRNQKTRWGSCSRRKNLNFNYKIVLLPAPLQDYIIVHELCHLDQMNHGRKFWDLVALQIPDYKQRMKELKSY